MSSTHSQQPLTQLTEHAKLRWLQRAGEHAMTVGEAWDEGYGVGVPNHTGKARLHPPTDTLIIAMDGHLVTVLRADQSEYRADHLVLCHECGLQYQPESDDRSCPWCEHERFRGGENV